MSIPHTARQENVRSRDIPEHAFARTRAPLPAMPGEYGDSDAYDRYMGRWSAFLARQFLDFAGIGAAERVLDVGSGTGSLTGVIAASTRASRIVGIDPVAQFVRCARQRFGDPRVTFDCGDAGELPYPDSDFDASLAQLSFHHFSEQENALCEMLRVTRSGGIVAACEWDSGAGMEMFHILRDTLAAVHPQSGAQHSLRQYAGESELLGLWQACGIEDAEEEALVVPLRFTDFDDFWIPFTEGPSGVLNRLNTLSPALREDFRRKLRHTLLDGKSDGPITLQARAWAVRGRVP